MFFKKQTLLQGAFVLMLAGLINRILGFGLRLVLVRILGDQGIGLFQMVFPIFVTFAIVTTFGLPVALSKFVSERMAKDNFIESLRLLKISLGFTIFTGIFFSFLFYFSAPFLANNMLQNSQTELILQAIAPALFFVSVASVFRGFFQGLRMMTPTAISQIIEQITRIIVTLIVIKKLLDYSLQYQATGAAIGVSAGEAIGLITLVTIFLKVKLDNQQNLNTNSRLKGKRELCKELIKFGFPITIGKIVASLMYSVEAILIPTRLQAAGYSVTEATSLYGQLSGMVQQIIYLPTIVTIAITSSLIPAVSESLSNANYHELRNRYQEALRLTFYTGLPAIIIFYLLPTKICDLLFGYPQAGNILKLISLGAIFLYLLQILSGVLQGLGKPNLVVINSIIGLVFEMIIIFNLVSRPNFGLKGAVIGIIVRFLIVTILNFLAIGREIGFRLDFKQLILKPIIAAISLPIIIPTTYQYFWNLWQSDSASLILSILVGLLTYLLLLIITKAITAKDLNRILN
ncbi:MULTISPECIES: stage V sporulation protein B [unclassified Candidatus Frackibacter]|uniref:stage V sporulation protein B n=1 Tax=unclassified Candidatus Frackibacter TaxID=2648818 RepID=UPI00210173AD|nr:MULTISPECIES: stage V sporulation protein B [unclassified Candidatus Frackibacter]